MCLLRRILKSFCRRFTPAHLCFSFLLSFCSSEKEHTLPFPPSVLSVLLDHLATLLSRNYPPLYFLVFSYKPFSIRCFFYRSSRTPHTILRRSSSRTPFQFRPPLSFLCLLAAGGPLIVEIICFFTSLLSPLQTPAR